MRAGSMSFPAASSIYALPRASSAMVRPPEAEPVSAASTLVATASDTSGPPSIDSTQSRTAANAGSTATTAPKPTRLAMVTAGNTGRAVHEGLRPAGEQGLQRERGGKQSGGGSEKEHAPAAQREPYEQRQSEQDPDETHGVIRHRAARRGRR